MPKAEQRCLRCGGSMVRGSLRIHGGYDAHVRAEFVIPGTETSWNPIEAFKQGISGEPEDRIFDLREMSGYACQGCGHLDLYAWVADEPGEP